MSVDANELMRSIIERIATGPEMSKNIAEAEAYDAMTAILNRQVSDVQAALFLIALRMKRETEEENRGAFRALLDNTYKGQASVEDLITIADPFNGFNRGLPMSPFLPPVLAACGLPCLSTGVETVAPKFGLTHHQVLAAAGKSVSLTPDLAARQIADGATGWAYLDQSITNPKLHGLRGLRRQIIKRPLLSTCEVMLHPLVARRRNIAFAGYVHANYPGIYAMLAAAAGYDMAIIVRGVEGGVVPSLQARSKLFIARGGEVGEPVSLKPESVGIHNAEARAVRAPFDDPGRNAGAAAERGLDALRGSPGAARDCLVYGAAIALFCTGKVPSLDYGAGTARRALESGKALARFEQAR